MDRTGIKWVPGKAGRRFPRLHDVPLRPVLGYVPHDFLSFVSAAPKRSIVTAAYEHGKGIYIVCLENPEVSDAKKVLRIPPAMDNPSPQLMTRKLEPRDLQRIQHIRVPDEPHIQGRVVKSATRLKESHKVRNPAMEPTEVTS